MFPYLQENIVNNRLLSRNDELTNTHHFSLSKQRVSDRVSDCPRTSRARAAAIAPSLTNFKKPSQNAELLSNNEVYTRRTQRKWSYYKFYEKRG